MTFWDFFHTHPIYSWIFIVFATFVIHMITDVVSKARSTRRSLAELEKVARVLQEQEQKKGQKQEQEQKKEKIH